MSMSLLLGLFFAHVAALGFGLCGLLVVLPKVQTWAANTAAVPVLNFGMQYAGLVHIVFGAITMLATGMRCLGARRTALFFVVSVVVSLSYELLGTSTGWPFGAYSYTSGLGVRVFERVPVSIPLSWFYMGFASYLLADALVQRLTPGGWPGWPVLLGTWLLVSWDIVLDPAMSHPRLPAQFWVWHVNGPYYGMPLTNLAGWALTGLTFLASSRYLWGQVHPGENMAVSIPLMMYVANLAFAMVLSLWVGLWIPPILAGLSGIGPVCAVLLAYRLKQCGTLSRLVRKPAQNT
ncbi:MAG: carotenoid biosynthesis protein, partial [Chloroflexota bacterium]